MDRRNFLKLAGATGLAVVGPTAFGEDNSLVAKGRRSYDPYAGKFWMFVNLGGGWDPTSHCDPKGAAYADEPGRMNNYLTEDIIQHGNHKVAPLPPDLMMAPPAGLSNDEFFARHGNKIMVVNGIDMLTNGHDAGNRHTWSGRLTEGHPCTPAFMAGAFGPTQPLAFLSSGGYSETSGLVSRTRTGNNLQVLRRLAYPDRANPDDEFSTFHAETTRDLIKDAHTEREAALLAAQGLPKIKQSMSTLFASRSGSNELKLLEQYLPETPAQNGLAQQGEVALAAYKAGIGVSAMLSMGGYDTHGNHDASHYPRLFELNEGLDLILTRMEQLGIDLNDVFICVGSDFGRTPGYNDGNGKDHWPITSQFFMGYGVPGNTVIGSTTDRHEAVGLNPDSLASDPAQPNLLPGNITNSIRRLAGLGESEFAASFPIDEAPLGLFNA